MNIKLFYKKYVYLEWSDELEGKDCVLAKTYQDLKDFVNSGDEDRFCKAHKGKEKPFTNDWCECDFCYYDPNLKVKKALIDGKSVQYYSKFDKWTDLKLLANIENYLNNGNWDVYEWRIKPTETWYVIFAENSFLRVSLIDNLSNTVFFSGTYEECGKWIDEHKSYAEILSAWKHGKIIQFKMKTTNDYWIDWDLKEYPITDSFEKCDWRIKPKEVSTHVLNTVIAKFTRRMTNKELAEWVAKGNGEVKHTDDWNITVDHYHNYFTSDENKEVDDNVSIREWSSDEWKEPLIEVK